jgi:hypothetical protein
MSAHDVGGTVRIAPDHTVAAAVVATGRGGRPRDLTVEWGAFVAEEDSDTGGPGWGGVPGGVPLH